MLLTGTMAELAARNELDRDLHNKVMATFFTVYKFHVIWFNVLISGYIFK